MSLERGVVKRTKGIFLAVRLPHPAVHTKEKANPILCGLLRCTLTKEWGIFMKFSEYFKPKFQTFDVVFLGLLLAFKVIFNAFPPINLPIVQLTFGFIPIAIAGYYYGPIASALVATLGDLFGTMIVSTGPLFLGFTFSAAITGLIFGFFLYKKPNVIKIVLAVVLNQMLITLLLNSYFISVVSSKATFVGLIATRALGSAVMIPIQIVVLIFITKVVFGKLKPMLKNKGR